MSRAFAAVALLSLIGMSSLAKGSPGGGGSLSGSVVRSGTGEPLAGAQAILTLVTTSSSSGNSTSVVTGTRDGLIPDASITAVTSGSAGSRRFQPVTTDRDGRFAFQNLEPGVYSLEVYCNQYARQFYGQRVTGGPATGIRLSSGQTRSDVVIPLVPSGNVAGVIRDNEGRAQTGVPVQLLRVSFNASGQRAFQAEANARTNDRGEFRMYWVTPGRYYVSAGTASGPNRPLTPNSAAASLNEIPDQSFAFTYFPGVFNPDSATVVEVFPAADVNGVDFAVARQQLYSVRGRISEMPAGRAPANASISLAYRTTNGSTGAFNAGAKYDPLTGEFELRNVPPGSYVVQAIAAVAPSVSPGEALVRISALALQPNARMPIEVSNADVSGVTLQLTSGISLPARISVDGLPLSSMSGWERVQIQLKPAVDASFAPNLQPAQPVAQNPKADGTFSIDGVSPGEFIVGPLTGLPQGYYVKEARFNQTDVLGKPLRIYASETGTLEILISSKAGSLTGTAVDSQLRTAAGAQVVLVPERQRERTDLYRSAAADTNGRFQFRSIPPGDYRVFSWEALESYAYFDSDLLRRGEPQSAAVHISESETAVTVRVIPANR